MHRNVELKAFDRNPDRTASRAIRWGALHVATLFQTDTYFDVCSGRLKLRQEEGRPAFLIRYDRADETRPRRSEYDLQDVVDADTVRAELTQTLGVATTVEKRRRLLLWEETVRIHLDDVKYLGHFVEIEAVAQIGSDLRREHDQVERLMQALEIAKEDVVSVSYADLMRGSPSVTLS